jgi:protein gp37
MAENSAIGWTDDTFNLVWGCQRVSPGCLHCYAESLSKRYGFDVWGPPKTTQRRVMSDNYWKQPIRWNKQATTSGVRRRVFCCSMADVFEDHPTNESQRPRLWEMIESTPMLDWLLLTKRPENMRDMLPPQWLHTPRQNVWLGTSTENQEWFDKRIDHLLSTPAVVHYLSAEPLIGSIDTQGYKPSWVIVGGESGRGARPMQIEWARELRNQCQDKGVAFFMKQLGGTIDKKHDLEDLPVDLRIRQFPRGV